MIALALGLAVVNQVFSLLDPQIFRIIIDRYATDVSAIPRAEYFRGVGLLILAFIGVAMVSRIAKNFQDYYVNVVSQSVGANLYADGIAHSLRLPYRTFEDRQSGAVLQQLQKARTDSRDLIGQAVNTVFISSFTFLLVLAYAFDVHWTIGAALLVLSPVLGVLMSVLGPADQGGAGPDLRRDQRAGRLHHREPAQHRADQVARPRDAGDRAPQPHQHPRSSAWSCRR